MREERVRIEDQRFSSEDLFALLGGFDAEMFVCPGTMTGPADRRRAKKYAKWRRNTIGRYERLGLVDTEGAPCDGLARVLEPLAHPHKTVSNASNPKLWDDEVERRGACVYLREDATGAVAMRAAGFAGGFYLMPLETQADVQSAILGMYHLNGAMIPAPPAEHRTISGDPNSMWANALMHNRPEEVEALAAREGFDPTRLLAVGKWWTKEGSRAQARKVGMEFLSLAAHTDSALGGAMFDRMTGGRKASIPTVATFVVADFSNISFGGPGEDGIAYRQPDLDRDGSFKSKVTLLFPAAGFSTSRERAPRAGDPKRWWIPELEAFCQFGCYDFHDSEEQFVERLLTIDENPNA